MSVDYGFNCTAGGQWYACSSGSRFVGCCTSDPCSNGCVQGNVRPGGFNATLHGKFPDASCGLASNFFSCSAGNTFWGCCKTNPCAATPAATCPPDDLVPAFLERPEQFNAYAPATPASDSGSNKGAIIGGAVGGFAVALIIGVLIFFYCRRRKQNRQQEASPETGRVANASTPMMKEKHEHSRPSEQYGGQSPPPTYAAPSTSYYQSDTPTKSHAYQQSYQQYDHNAEGPSELPAEIPLSPAQNRYSELPAEGSSSTGVQRFSELPGGSTQVASELESPQVSPRPLQSEFSTDLAKIAQSEAATESRN